MDVLRRAYELDAVVLPAPRTRGGQTAGMTMHRILSRVILCSLLSAGTLGGCSSGSDLDDGTTLASAPSIGADDVAKLDADALITLALQRTDDPELREAIVKRLRTGGQAQLDALIAEYRELPDRPEREDAAWRALIDEVAGQRDAHYGGLFWHTDLSAALADAEVSRKPVLTLRMLGELTSEYSCANSRLFRTLLYADPELAAWLEQNFVLHWSSERPVPRVAIDFGDGRVVERTITGNSAHFVLDPRGRTLDVIPGLLAASSFRAALEQSLALHRVLANTRTEAQWQAKLAAHHEAAFSAAAIRLTDELTRVRGEPQDLVAMQAWLAGSPAPRARVPAVEAVPMAIGKSKIEAPILAAAPGVLGGAGAGAVFEPSGQIGPRDDLERMILGARLAGDVTLHANSLAIIASERPLDRLVPEDQREAATQAMLDALLVSIRQDTSKNALELHPRVHAELAARAREAGGDRGSLDFADVDAWVYASLFETPAEDAWLGLVDPTVYTGLVDGGLSAHGL